MFKSILKFYWSFVKLLIIMVLPLSVIICLYLYIGNSIGGWFGFFVYFILCFLTAPFLILFGEKFKNKI